MRNLIKPFALVSLMTLGGCLGTGPQTPSLSTPTPVSTAAQTPTSATKYVPCSALVIVQLSRKDTTGTKAVVEGNNRVLTDACR